MSALITIIVLIIGVGGISVAADGAKPGDALFGVDRAVEKIQLSFAGSEKKDEIRIKIAEERLKEIEEVMDGEDKDAPATSIKFEDVTEIEADVFSNETVVKIEAMDNRRIFITLAKSEEEITNAITEEYGFDSDKVQGILNVEIEDRESRPEDKEIRKEQVRGLSQAQTDNVVTGIRLAAEVLGDISGEVKNETAKMKLQKVVDRLNQRIQSLPEEVEVEVESETKSENGSTGSKSKIKVKDGEVEVEIEEESNDNGKPQDKSNGGNDGAQGSFEAEADVFTDTTVIKVEINGQKEVFTSQSKTKAEVAADIAQKYGNLSQSEIEAALGFEIENRQSRPEDLE